MELKQKRETAVVEVEALVLQTIGSQMFQAEFHPCNSLGRSQQRHEESASLGDSTRETPERTEMDIELE